MSFQKPFAPRKSQFWAEKQLNPQTQGDSPQAEQLQQNPQPESLSLLTDANSRIEPSLFNASAVSKDLLLTRGQVSIESNVMFENISAISEQVSPDQKVTTSIYSSKAFTVQKRLQAAIRLNGNEMNFASATRSGGVQKLPPLSVKKPYLMNNSFSQNEKIFPVLEDKNEEMKNSPTLQLSRERILALSNTMLDSEFSEDEEEEEEEDEASMDPARLLVRKRLRKVFYASYFVGIAISLTNRIRLYGTLKKIEENKEPESEVQEEKKKPLLPLMPSHNFRILWTFILLIMIILTTLLTPYDVSFIDGNDNTFTVLNIIFDVLFGIDIILNFVSAYFDPVHGLVTDFKSIALYYLKGWFLIDLIAVLPFDQVIAFMFHDTQGNTLRLNKLFRLVRFPRLYRLFKILRLFKMLKLFSTSPIFNKILKKVNLNIGFMRMLKFIVNIFFLNHFVGCLWFFICKIDDFDPETWVAKQDLIDANAWTQYVASFYWASQTLTTVGYGDIEPGTPIERIIAILWMIVGVGIYSFTIGNLSSLLYTMDRRDTILKKKISAFNNFASKAKIPEFLRQKVRRFFELNHKENVYYWIEPSDMLKHLPENLKSTLLLYSYRNMIKDIEILEMNANFTALLLTHLKLLKLEKREILYREEDPSQEIYFISKGSVKLVTDSGQGIFTLVQGTYFGELEILDNTKRVCFAQACESTIIIVCDKTVFLEALKQFPDVENKITKVARYRKDKLQTNLAQLSKEEPASPNRVPRKMLKSTEYFYNVLLKTGKQSKKGKVGSQIMKNSSSPPKGVSPISHKAQPDNLKSFKRLQDFLGALELKKTSQSADVNQASIVNKAGDAFKRSLKARNSENQSKTGPLEEVLIDGEKKDESNMTKDSNDISISIEKNQLPTIKIRNFTPSLRSNEPSQEEKKEGGSMVKTANFLEPAKSGDKTEKNPSIPSIHIREISNENKPEVSITNSAVIEGENPTNQAKLDKSNKENDLRTKLQNKDTFEDKPEYFTYIKNGLNEVKKLKDLVECLYSQMNTKKQDIVDSLGIIAERQMEMNMNVEKIFSVK